jgi:CHAD domain
VGLGVAVAVARIERERRAAATAAGASGRKGRQASRLQRLTLEQLTLAISLLEGREPTPAAQTVHETRKALKRARALVRLQRTSLGPRRYARESAALRDAARQLAGARDAEVMVEALDAMVQRHPKRLAHSGGVRALRGRLVAERERSGSHSTEGVHTRAHVVEELRAVRERLERWTPRKGDSKVAREGVRRLYRQGLRRGRRARKAPTSVALHQWRKRAKDLRYVAEMLDGRDKQQRRRLRRVAQLADRLGETLGEEHDLALLAEQVRSNRDCFKGEKPTRKTLERHIARRRSRLRARAWQLGERLYRRKPDRFARRLLGS